MRIALLLLVAALAGCLGEPQLAPETQDADDEPLPDYGLYIDVVPTAVMNFTENVVDAAVGYTNDLYEPTMEVSDNGVIYVTGHTILVDTTGAPVFKSDDGGKTWSQLPFLGPATMPGDIHGATPPPSDEIFLMAGDDGWLYGVDITAATFPVNAWNDDGNTHAYHNPNAYDRVSSTQSVCGAAGLNDRPWGAYANGKLLMVNNPGGGSAPLGRVEIGVMDVPPALPVGIGAPVVGAQWNYCPTVGGSIPGIPDMRADHFFAAPQLSGGNVIAVIGNAKDIFDVEVVTVMPNSNSVGGTMNNGHVAFDAEGNMFVAARNNTQPIDGEIKGRIHVAVSTNDGQNFTERIFKLGNRTTSIYLDGNMHGPGVLLSWAEQTNTGTDYYVAHMEVAHDGGAILQNVSRVLSGGPGPSAHVQGAAVGPNGEAYIVTFHGGYSVGAGTPLHVWVQQDGPLMPTPLVEGL